MNIRIDTRKIKYSPFESNRAFTKIYQRFAGVVARDAVRIVRKNTPRRTGHLRRSTSVSFGKELRRSSRSASDVTSLYVGDDILGDKLAEDAIGGNIDRRTNIHISPTAHYAPFVNEGTQYQPAQRFIENSIAEINLMMARHATSAFGNWYKSWKWTPATGGRSPFFDDYYSMGGI